MIGFIFQLLLILSSLYIGGFYLEYTITTTVYLIVLIIWLITIWATHKNKPKYYQKKPKYVLAPFFRSYIVLLILSTILLFIFRIDISIIKNVLISLMIYSLVELIIYFIIVKIQLNKGVKKEEFKVQKYTQKKFKIEKVNIIDIVNIDETNINLSKNTLLELYNYNEPAANSKYAIDNFEQKNIDLLLLNEKVNNIKEINKYFSKAYNSLNVGGYLIIGYKDLDDVETEILKNKGLIKFFKNVKYYIFDRAFPKLPFFNRIHSFLSGDKNKVISKTEVWGRLIYGGFDVKKEVKEGNFTYLIAQKDRTPSKNPSPSYSPLIRLNRVSLGGDLIKIYKVRSMYPYSEFLQEKVYEMNSLSSTGKFSEDFRITKLGKIYRKYWLDELPQFLDWFRGSIKFVGIRAMSQHFFSLYSKEYQELFYQVKPGIISPIFDEETDSFEAIQKIEQEYLEKYLKNPVKTDLEYFFITLKHMLKGVRSK